MKQLTTAVTAFVLISMPTIARELDYISAAIYCSEETESYVSSNYYTYLKIIDAKELKTFELKINEKVVQNEDGFLKFNWSFYITPNELTGYIVSVPNELFIKDGEYWVNKEPLILKSRSHKQNHDILILMKKEGSNQAVDTTAANARLFDSDTSKSTITDVEALTEAAVVSP